MIDDMINVETFLKEHPEIICEHRASWDKYPRHRWVYETTRLLDMQHIEWTPFCVTPDRIVELNLLNLGINILTVTEDTDDVLKAYNIGNKVYANHLEGDYTQTAVAIFKGEIKWLSHYNLEHNTTDSNINGDIRLRINALISLHFKKFSGTITVQTYGKQIIAVNLYASESEYELLFNNDIELSKHIVRIYNNRPWGK